MGAGREGGEARDREFSRSKRRAGEFSDVSTPQSWGIGGPGKAFGGTPAPGGIPSPDKGGFSKEFMEAMMSFFSSFQRKNGGDSGGGGNKRVVLDEKYFRRVDKFTGDSAKFRGWYFDLMVNIGQVDRDLSAALEKMVTRWNSGNQKEVAKWDPVLHGEIKDDLYRKYSGELFGVLISLTDGEPKSMLRGLSESGTGSDGFKGLIHLVGRYDRRTQASLLQAYMEVVNPPGIK